MPSGEVPRMRVGGCWHGRLCRACYKQGPVHKPHVQSIQTKQNVRKGCAVAVCLGLKGTAESHCRYCVCWAAGPCGQHLTAYQCGLISYFL